MTQPACDNRLSISVEQTFPLMEKLKSKREEITTYFEKFGKIVDIDFFIPESEVLLRYKDRE